jgi:hypothetical protein
MNVQKGIYIVLGLLGRGGRRASSRNGTSHGDRNLASRHDLASGSSHA